jgi:integrase
VRRKLDDRWIRTTSEQGEIWDLLLPGFGVRLGAKRRTWQVAIRRPGAPHPTRIKIGTFPPMSLADARSKARKLMETGAPSVPTTVSTLITEFLDHGMTKTGRPFRRATADAYRRVLGRYAAPISHRPVADVTRMELAALIRAIARDSGVPTASLARSMITRLLGWAVATGYVDHNPMIGTPSYAVGKRSRVLSDPELRALWAATETYTDYHAVLRLCLWTGCRRSEAGGARWSEFSPDGRLWTISGARTKNHRPLALPLATQTVAYLRQVPVVSGRDHLFGVRSDRGFNTWSASKARLDARLRFNADWDLHDCRRVVESRLAELRVPKEHVNKVLNHAAGPVTEAYDRHHYVREKAAALRIWADHLASIVAAE